MRPAVALQPAPIPLHRPDLGVAEEAAATRVLRSGWVSAGPEAEAFEREFAAFVGAPRAVAVSSGTAALEIALRALGIGPGDDVVTVSHSFVATANAIRETGARPVLVDIDAATYNIDPSRIEPALSPRTRAILAVHQLGMPCDLAALGAIARARGLALVEDAACAAGSEIAIDGRWERIGKPHGDIACFSFHGRKPMTTGEGGMITAASAALAGSMRRIANHGVSVPAHRRHAGGGLERETYVTAGSNRRLSDIQAAIGREQLRRLPGLIERRRALAANYRAALDGAAFAVPPAEPESARSNWQSYCVRLADGIAVADVRAHLAALGIATRPGVMCAHREPSWPPGAWRAAGSLVASETASDRCLMLPLYPAMSCADQNRVLAALAEACGA